VSIFQKLMFGRHVQLVAHGDVAKTLRDELALYPDASTDTAELLIEHADLALPTLPATPRQHGEVESGFVVKRGHATACFRRLPDATPAVSFSLADEGGPLRRWQRKWKNIQFTSRAESGGQVLHELVLLPALHFFDELVPLHASSLRLPDGRVVALGGTGGIGKTSLELELCRHRGCSFLADDISVLDGAGRLWPNFNYPKIYAYNVQGDSALRERLIPARDVVNRVQWEFKRQRGGERARRRISPLSLYGRVMNEAAPLSAYWLLVPASAAQPEAVHIDAERATEMTLAVLRSEFQLFHSHIAFHEFNCIARGTSPILTVDGVFARWRKLLLERLATVDCALLRIPRKMDHEEFKRSAGDIVMVPPP
jgi:hypothetical protein